MNALFNKDITFDSRNISTFGKAIRLVDSSNFDSIRITSISEFPKDLIDCELDYAGWYEDGWIANRSWIELKTSKEVQQNLILKGVVPNSNSYDTQNLTVKIGDSFVKNFNLKPGNFEITIPFRNLRPSNIVRVEFNWANSIRLPQPDGRLVTAKIQHVKTSS